MSNTSTTTDEPTEHRIPITSAWAHVRTANGDLQLPALEREATCDAAVEVEVVDFDSGGESILDGETVIRLTITQEYGGLSSSETSAHLRAQDTVKLSKALTDLVPALRDGE